ncbi:MAG TPA: hypothetical protein VFU86_10375 [Terriglobales bacterium]|nr:hypothetical protein [Terriglobales bacterium]
MFLHELKGLTLKSADIVVNEFIGLASEGSRKLPCLLLQFGDFSLSIYNPMTLTFGEFSVDSDQPEFRDSIRELIRSSVTGVREDGDAVRIDFSNVRALTISLEENRYRGPEAIVFKTPNGFIVV